MPLSRLSSAAFIGLEATHVEVEVDLTLQKNGLLRIVGLPDAAVKEAKDRVMAAIKNSGVSIDGIQCTIHLAPAEIKKIGAFYDLPISLGILTGLGVFSPLNLPDYLICGELSLSGEVRATSGILALSLLAKKLAKKGVVVPKDNAQEAAMIPGLEVIPVQTLTEAIHFFKEGKKPKYPIPPFTFKAGRPLFDMSEIKGQESAKRALEIAAAGKHNVLMCGPPGTGKTMLAKAFVGILPPLQFEEALEVTNVYSLAGDRKGIAEMRPFRSPHHSISSVAMIGGGSYPKPGEISLAHHGVLFLDELPEFSRSTLEVLRQPLEDKIVSISRAGGKITFPTDVICLAAMNPCPCGFFGHPQKPCRDTQAQIERYKGKISGPLLDRFDLHLEVPPLPAKDLFNSATAESSEVVRSRVLEARMRLARLKPQPASSLNGACKALLKEAIDQLCISARAQNRLLKVAHTIAALTGKDTLGEDQLLEALSYSRSI